MASSSTPPRDQPWLLPAGVGLFLLGGLIVLAVTCAPGENRRSSAARQPAASTVQLETAAPLTVAASFCSQLQLSGPGPAYPMLSTRLKSQISLERFEATTQQWLSREENRWELSQRRLEARPVLGDRAEVRLLPPAPHQKPWTWTLLREKGGWKLDRLEGFLEL